MDDFGHGIQSYFTLIQSLILIFGILTVLFLPVGYIYTQGKNYEDIEFNWVITKNLGNMGQRKALCALQYTDHDAGDSRFKCGHGLLSDIVHAGMNSGENVNDFCGANDLNPVVKHCTDKHFKLKELKDQWRKSCLGKKTCEINMQKYVSKYNKVFAEIAE